MYSRSVFETREAATAYLCHFKEVRLIYSEGLKRCFEGLFDPQIPHNPILTAKCQLVLFLQQFAMETMDDLAESIKKN